MKDKEFWLKVSGAILLAGLIIFFAVLQSKTGTEITDVGTLIGGLVFLVTHSFITTKKES